MCLAGLRRMLLVAGMLFVASMLLGFWATEGTALQQECVEAGEWVQMSSLAALNGCGKRGGCCGRRCSACFSFSCAGLAGYTSAPLCESPQPFRRLAAWSSPTTKMSNRPWVMKSDSPHARPSQQAMRSPSANGKHTSTMMAPSILAFLGGGRKDFEVAKILPAARGPLTTVLEEWGLLLDNEILPSFKAASCRGEATMLNAKVRGEWTSSTLGALAWLLHLSCASHRAKSKEQAGALLRGFLVAFASPASAAAHSMAEDIKQALSSCQQPPQGHWGSCCHLRIAIDAMLSAGPAGQMWTNLTNALQHIYLARPVCVASRRLLAGVLQRLCQDVDGKVSDMQPPKNFSSFSMPQGRNRKLRIDEDYKRYLVSEAVAAKRAHCGAQYAKTTGDVHHETARKWDEAHMANYIAAAWHTMGSSTLVSLACDASKVGNPAEETVMFLAWDMESNKAVVLPPQAA